ncbi:MAG: VWA domain-containing protein [Verrucomicrobia bacterium]|nr:VWA domain-containing protein [Verrucomicrobiota bacterium]
MRIDVFRHCSRFLGRLVRTVLVGGGLFLGVSTHGAESTDAILRFVTRAARTGDIAGLEPLKDLRDGKAGDAVVRMIEDRKVPDAAKQRIAELVAQWPAKGGLDYFEFHLRAHPQPGDEMLRFYAELGCVQFKPWFLALIAPLRKLPVAEIKEPARYALALRALGRFPEQTEDAVALIAALFDEKYPHAIRASAVDTLGSIRSRRGLPALMAVVKDSAIGEAAQRSLFRLTGQDFDNAPEKWTAWFKDQGAKADLKMLSLSDWETHKKEQAAAAPKQEQKEFSAQFYGVEIKTRHCLFIIDVSGSMAGERLAQLKEQMSNLFDTLRKKPKDLRFGIIAFHNEPEPCLSGRGLLLNEPASIRRASHFVEKILAGGGTAMVTTLQFAAMKVLPGSDVDTIYFLSDGQPTDGRPEDVLVVVNKIHEQFQIKFHTIAIGEAVPPADGADRQPSLLEQMAKRTGGTYTVR